MQPNEVLDLGVRVYQSVGWMFLRATVGSSLFCFAALLFWSNYVFPSFIYTQNPNSTSAQMIEVVVAMALAIFVAGPLFLLGVSYSTTIVTYLASDFILGNAPSLESAVEKTRTKVFQILVLSLREILIACMGLAIGIALLLLSGYLGNTTSETDTSAAFTLLLGILGVSVGIIFFIVVVCRHALAPVAMALENLRAGDAAKRSVALLKAYGNIQGGGSAIFAGMIVCLIVLLFMSIGLYSSLDVIGYPDSIRNAISSWPYAGVIVTMLGYLPLFAMIWTVVPLWASMLTIIYYSRRIRLEGYDVEALAEDVWRADRANRFEL